MSKYNAKRTEVDGYVFDSKAEAGRYSVLKMLEKADGADRISELELQPKFLLIINGKKVGTYIADFRYIDSRGNTVIEDVKGMKTPVYRLKKKIVEALYNIEIVEITN